MHFLLVAFIYCTKFDLNQRVSQRIIQVREGIIIISHSITQMLRHFTEEEMNVTCWWYYSTFPGITEVQESESSWNFT